MAKKNVTSVPKKENTNNAEKVSSFITKNKVVLITVLVAVIVVFAGFAVFETVKSGNIAKNLTVIEKAEFTLSSGAAGLSDAELEGRYQDALKAVEPYTTKGGIVGARASLFKAELNYKMNNLDVAKDAYLAAASKVKGSYLTPICYFNVASVYEDLNDTKKALEYYELAAKDKEFADPTRALFAVGRLKEAALDYTGAKEAYEKITAKNNPNDPWESLAKTRILTLQVEGKIE